MSETVAFSAATKQRIEELVGRYPRAQAALIPTLYLAQDEFGYLKPEVMSLVARTLDLPLATVLSTAMFYTMLRKKPVGRFHLQICTNVSCYLRGSDELMAAAKAALGIHGGETTPDGLFTLDEVQCLCDCGAAPALQVNRDDFRNMTADSLRNLIADLRAKGSRTTLEQKAAAPLAKTPDNGASHA